MEVDDVVARARGDDVGAAAAVDRVRPRAARDDVDARGARDRNARGESGGVDILEIGDGDIVAARLIGGGEIDRDRAFQRQRVHAGAAVQRDFRAMIGDDIVARARVDDVGAAAAIQRVVARTARDDIRARGARDRNARRQRGRIYILDVDDGRRVARGLIGAIGQIDRDRGFQDQCVDPSAAVDAGLGPTIVDRVVAGARVDDVGPTASVHGVGAGAGRDHIRARRARDGEGGGQRRGVEILEVENLDVVADRLIRSRGEREIDGGGAARHIHDQGVHARPAVDAGFRPVIMDGVVAGARRDHIRAAAAVDGVGARSAREDIHAGRACDRNARQQGRSVDVLEVDDGDVVAERLVRGVAEIHGDRRFQRQGVDARAAIERDLGAVIIDAVIARARVDDIGAAAPVDRIVSRSRRDDIGPDGPRHRERIAQGGCVQVFKIMDGDRVARGLVRAGGHGEINRRRPARDVHDQRIDAGAAVDAGFRPMIEDGVVAPARRDGIGPAPAVDGVGPRAAGDDIDAGRARQRDSRDQGRCVDVLEIENHRRIPDRLIGDMRQIHRDGGVQHQRVDPQTAVDGDFRAMINDAVVASPRVDDVGAPRAVDGVVARSGRDHIRAGRTGGVDRGGQDGCVEIEEVGDDDAVPGRLIDAGRYREIHGGHAARSVEDERVVTRTAVDAGFRSMIIDGVVARARRDHIRAAVAVDGVGPAAALEDIRARRAGDREARRQGRRVEVLEIVDRDGIARGLIAAWGDGEVDGRGSARGVHDEGVDAGAAFDRDLGSAVVNGVVARARVDDVGAAAAVDRIGAGTARQDIGARRTGDRDARRENGGVDVLEIRDDRGDAADLIGGVREIDGDGGFQDERVNARSAVDGNFAAVIGDDIVAAAGVDDVRAAAAVDRVVARAGHEHVGAARAGHDQPARQSRRVEVLEIVNRHAVAERLIGARREREIDRRRSAGGVHHQRIDAGPALDGNFVSVIMDGVVARPRVDDVGAAAAVDRVRARAARDHIGARGAGDRNPRGERGGVDILEVQHERVVAAGLIGRVAQVDRRRDGEGQRVHARSAVDGAFGPMIDDHVVAGARVDDIGAAAAVDRVRARARRDDVGARRASHAQRRTQGARVQIFEIDDIDAISGCLIRARRHRETDGRRAAGGVHDQRVLTGAAVDRGFAAVIRDDVVARPGVDDVGAAAAVDRVRARPARDDIRARRTCDRNAGEQAGGVHILEIEHGRGIAARLIRDIGEIDGDGGGEHQRVDARSAVDGDFRSVIDHDIVARARVDDVGAAAAIDGVGALGSHDGVGAGRTRDRDALGQRARVEVLEIHDVDGVADGLIGAGRHGEVDRRHPARRVEDQRVDACPAIDRNLGPMEMQGVVAGARVDDVGAAVAVDGVVSRSADEDIGARRARDRDARCQRRRVHVLEIDDERRVARGLIGGIGQIDRGGGQQLQRVDAAAAVERRLGAMIGDDIVAGPGVDDIGAPAAIDRIIARTADEDIGARRTRDRNARRQRRGVDVLEIHDRGRVAGRLIGGVGEIDRDGREQRQRVHARPAVYGKLRPVIGHVIVAGPGVDDVGAAAAVDGVGARARRDHVRARGAGHAQRRRHERGVEALEIDDVDAIADRLILSRRKRQIDGGDPAGSVENERVDAGTAVDVGLGSVIIDGVVPGPRVDDVGAASAIDRVGSAAARDDVDARRTADRNARGQSRGVDVLEVEDGRVVPAGLVGGIGEVDRRRRLERQCVDAGPAVDGDFGSVIRDRVVARARVDDIGAAPTVDGVGTGSRRDDIGAARACDRERRGQQRSVQILEIGDGDAVAECLIAPGRDREIHRRDPAGYVEDQRVDTRTAVDRCFRPVIIDGVVAASSVDDVGAAIAVDGVGARASHDHVRAQRTRDRDAREEMAGVDVLEIHDIGVVADGLIRAIGEIDRDDRVERERVDPDSAVERDFRSVIGDGIVARARVDDIRAAIAVDGVVTRARGDDVGAGRADHVERRGQNGGVQILEIGHRDGVPRRLIGSRRQGEIHARHAAGGIENQTIDAGSAVDGAFGPVIIDDVVAAARRDRIRAAAAVDRVVARAALQHVGAGRTRDRDAREQARGVDVLEIDDQRGIAAGLIGGIGEVDRRRRLEDQGVDARAAIQGQLRAVIDDRVVARARGDDVGAAIAVDRIPPAAADDEVGAGRARDREALRQGARVEVLEIRDVDVVAKGLVRARRHGKVHGRGSARSLEDQRIDAGSAIDRGLGTVIVDGVVAAPGIDDVRPAVAVDGVGASAARYDIRARGSRYRQARCERGGVDVLEIDDKRGVAARLIGGIGEIDRDRGREHERVDAGTAVDADLGPVIGDSVVARPGADDIGAAAAVDRVIARAAGDDVRARGPGDGHARG